MQFKRLVLSLVVVCVLTPCALAQKLAGDDLENSIRYINDLQNADGGFRPAVTDAESDLGAMNAALRAIKYFHPRARPRNRDAMPEFVAKCYHPSSGGFSSKPGREPDVRSTAMGLMVMAELKMDMKDRGPAITRYFAEHSKTMADFYIAAAALNAAELPPPKNAKDWIAAFEKTGNSDGTFGKEPADTASAVNTILRLGGKLNDPLATANALRSAQQDDGGFGKPGEKSDLATIYRCMRALWMLKSKPNADRLHAFIARCRNDDGGYGVQPGQPSSVSATYFAAIVMHWLEALEAK
jgi:prenyltransferase beta subunit